MLWMVKWRPPLHRSRSDNSRRTILLCFVSTAFFAVCRTVLPSYTLGGSGPPIDPRWLCYAVLTCLSLEQSQTVFETQPPSWLRLAPAPHPMPPCIRVLPSAQLFDVCPSAGSGVQTRWPWHPHSVPRIAAQRLEVLYRVRSQVPTCGSSQTWSWCWSWCRSWSERAHAHEALVDLFRCLWTRHNRGSNRLRVREAGCDRSL